MTTEVRRSPDGKSFAIKTGPSMTFPWFIFHVDTHVDLTGRYSSGNDTTDWQPATFDPDWVAPQPIIDVLSPVPSPEEAPEFPAVGGN